MVLYGLTGGVGMGKSTAAGILAGWGVPVVDADEIAREMVSPGSEALREIQARFGAEVARPDGSLDRRRLAEVVFSDESRRKDLESILHPRIRAEWKRQAGALEAAGHAKAVVVIPLLFETGAEEAFGQTICVACSAGTQQERLQRRGWTAAQAAARVRSQWAVARKMDRADCVVWSEGTLRSLELQLRRIFKNGQSG